MKIDFRVDSSPWMGSGHLSRCLTLAEALREYGVVSRFICRGHPGNLSQLLRQKGFSVIELPEDPNAAAYTEGRERWLCTSTQNDGFQTLQAIKENRPDWLVVDHYGIGAEWEAMLKPFVGKIMVIDDVADRKHDCDMLLDQNYFLNPEQRYRQLVPDRCEMLLGPEYALLRKEFVEKRMVMVRNADELNHILIFLTAGDDQGETLKVMEAIRLFGKSSHVDVVIGTSNPDREIIARRCEELGWEYHCQVNNMATLIARADLVIGAGGASNWERCALGVPSLVVVLAENQNAIAQALHAAGVVMNMGWAKDLKVGDYVDALQRIGPEQLEMMSCAAVKMVDAQGAVRVAKRLLAGSLNHGEVKVC